MLLITTFVALRVVAGSSRTRAGSPQAVSRRPCCAVALRRAWHGHGMASVNQTRPHCLNQIGKTNSKPLAARHGGGTAWARHAMCESALTVWPSGLSEFKLHDICETTRGTQSFRTGNSVKFMKGSQAAVTSLNGSRFAWKQPKPLPATIFYARVS